MSQQPHLGPPEREPTTPLTRKPDRRLRMSQTAIVVCCIVFAIMIVSIVLALAGDTDGAGALVFLSIIIGGIIACVFHRRWP